jgi:hypothetical protein
MAKGIVMNDETMASDDGRITSRRGFLAGGLGVGIAAVAGAVGGAVTRTDRDDAPDRVGVAHGGAIHTQMHGGVTHTHDKLSHKHAVMVHALDEQTIRSVDAADRG